MHIFVVLIELRGVSFTCKPGQTLFVNVNPEWFVASDDNVDSEIKFVAIDKQRVRDVAGDN